MAPKTLLFFFGFLVFTAVSGSLLCALWVNMLPVQSVLRHGVETDAVLNHKYIDDTGHFWFRYYFETANGNIYRSEIEVSETTFYAHETGIILPMRYVATNPASNVLVILENDIQTDYRFLIGLSVLVIAIAVFLAGGWMRMIPIKGMDKLKTRLQSWRVFLKRE